ncbi:Cell death abnormality protein 1 [Geodia barretti]|uniref:Cell death abnormality protein 1 n=1 Tax=Geodia barretti TaxID=519541 RepID=A0AA35WX30_GEOBA|nr:Cell death abnormality protein 1 [Geodia barretti]
MERALGVAFFLLICALGVSAQNVTADCSSDPPPCGWNANCTDTEDGPYCSCEPGYFLNVTSDCEMCPWGMWGLNCSFDCDCPDNTTNCNHVNGTCPEEDVYDCDDDPCGDTECRNVNQTFECYCPPGQRLLNETQCEMCEEYTWGVECSEFCNCSENATACNPVTGVCPEDEVNCASNPCGARAQCMDISDRGEYRCYCTNGSILMDNYYCKNCSAGTWGANCTQTCDCGADGNSCNNVNGECICNACWSGTNCMDAIGGECVCDFLRESNKASKADTSAYLCENNLNDMFGGFAYPEAPDDTLVPVAVKLMDLDNSVVIERDPINYDSVDREDVGQGPLVQLTWRVDKNQDRPNAVRGLDRLREGVKLGNIRSTLIINDREDSADVTLNSGVRRNGECDETDDDIV